jgi:hypothetical protein
MKILFMKKLFLFLTVALLTQYSFSQNDTLSDYYQPVKNNTDEKITTGINTGAFTTFSGKNNCFGYYFSPHVSIPVSNRFSLQTGFVYGNYTLPGIYSHEGSISQPINSSYSLFYASGIYKLNSKVFLTGGAYTSLNNASAQKINPAFSNYFKGGKFGIGYNINDKSTLYFELQIHESNQLFNNFGTSGLFDTNQQFWGR